jgi:deoxycytidylate deaminase
MAISGERCDSFCPRAQKAPDLGSPGYGDCFTIHAETNALIRADWGQLSGGTLYVTSVPCWECAKVISNTPLTRVISHNDVDSVQFRDPVRSIGLMRDCGLEVLLRG